MLSTMPALYQLIAYEITTEQTDFEIKRLFALSASSIRRFKTADKMMTPGEDLVK
jgi:hypothetical protein